MSKYYKIIVDGRGEYFYAEMHKDGCEEIGAVYLSYEGMWRAWHEKPGWFGWPKHTSRTFLTEAQARTWMKKELCLADPEMPQLKDARGLKHAPKEQV